jgi:hypothetical protein
MIFGDYSFCRRTCRDCTYNEPKVYKKLNKIHTRYEPKGDKAHNQANQGPKQVENKPKIQSNQLNSAQHHHGPSPGDHKRQPNKIGLKVAHLGCGRTPVACLVPNLVRSIHTASPRMVHSVKPRFNVPGG